MFVKYGLAGIAISLICLLNTSCAQQTQLAKVIEESQYTSDTPDTYTVAPGDTLYAISFRFGVDYRDIATWNHLNTAYAISPGQKLIIHPPINKSTRTAANKKSKSIAEKRTKTSIRSAQKQNPSKTKTKRAHLKRDISKTTYVAHKNIKKRQSKVKTFYPSSR